MAISFTPAQKAAIDCDAPLILVSAAAGSGKTAVLTERIMRHLRAGHALENLLVVTFTDASAADMKDKITEQLHAGAGLSSHAAARNAALLGAADISTIHAFCRKLVKAHFQAVELDPAFRVGDEAELGVIKAEVMNAVFEEAYSQDDEGNTNEFLDLVDVYGGKSGDWSLERLIYKLHDFLQSDPFPQEAAARCVQAYENVTSLDESPWAVIARGELERGLAEAAAACERALQLCNAPNGPAKYAPRLEADAQMIAGLQDLLTAPLPQLYEAFRAVEWGKLASISQKDDVDPELKARVMRIRKSLVRKRVEDLTKGVFLAPPDKMLADIAALRPRIAAMMRLAGCFARAFAREKRARNILDFPDMEHFAIRILYPHGPDDMTPGPVAAALTCKYHEVLIDEYQDANAVQELILSAVSARRFMVGDVKQSIYRFRRANPALFREKYENYTPLGTDTLHTQTPPPASPGVRIVLAHNFRSRPEVINGINYFFRRLMTKDSGEITYDDAAALQAGANFQPYPHGKPVRVRLEVVDCARDDDETADSDATPPTILETRHIARRITEMITARYPVWDAQLGAWRPCRFSDMVIIARSINSIAVDVVEELKNCGVPAIAEVQAGFFDQYEVKLALAFLRVIDNPRQDIDLISVLHSCVYGVSEDELLAIRSMREDGDFYDCVCNLPHHKFLADLAKFRAAASTLSISRLLGLIYDTTRLPAHVAAMAGGEARLANLRLLLEHAMSFEETRLTGLFHFTRYIAALHDARTADRVGAAAHALPADCVRLMTIHKSKGLEFPIVFVSFLGRKFNTDDEKQSVILHNDAGAGTFYTDTAARTRSNTLPRYTLSRLTRRENRAEELRCLYVAMTRAMQTLTLTAHTANYARAAQKWSDRSPADRFLDWLMPCVLEDENNGAVELHVYDRTDLEETRGNAGIEQLLQAADRTDGHTQSDYTNERAPAPAIPSKLSISELKRLYAADLTPDSTYQEQAELPPLFEPPAFIKAEQGLTAMRMGSILHAVTEHLDYHAHTTPAAVDALIADLIAKNLVTPDEAVKIDRTKILTLTASPLADRIRAAAALHREVPFVMQLDTGTLVHGIIDAFFEENGEIVLIDFKSDHMASISEAELAALHAVQLDTYKKAVASATAMPVKEVILYSFALGRGISVFL